MTQSFRKTDSAVRVMRASRRHLRLARRTGNATAIELANRISAPRESLSAAIDAHQTAQDATQDAFDDWEVADRALDRTVKTCDRRCLDWDEEHAGARSRQMLFAGSTPGQVANAARDVEPDIVARMVRRGAELPEGHPAIALLPRLTEQAAMSRTAHRTWIDAAQAEAVASAAVEIAKIQVMRIYYDNQIDIDRSCGADIAEACFPTLRRTARVEEPAADDPTQPVT